ncbi:ornithine cyclodeaminase family protein [Nocardioides sp. LHG3406-4]|uniref:ornithine cyclodeaminase family protein n=1 Tax=Nocardioides sp. LHG3406-4 TaxID=2804575 RepID=UPI003CF452C4
MLGSPVRVSYNLETAELDAIIVGEPYSPEFPTTHANFGIATAAASMVGTKLLAKRDTPLVGVLGSGNQARLHVAALTAVRRIQDVKVYSRNPDRAAAFAAETSEALGLRVTAVSGAEEAVAHSDVVICATNASTPVLDGSWLSPGAHVVSLVTGDSGLQTRGHVSRKRRELDDETLRRADVIGTSSVLQVDLDRGADLYDSREKGLFPAEKLVDLGHLMRGEHPGRVNDAQITVFKNSALYGSGDQAITRLLIDKARSRGLGTRINTSPGTSPAESR